ncbi:hypothetical protein ACOSQ3_017029 [Xanthoceras sorbifolium]
MNVGPTWVLSASGFILGTFALFRYTKIYFRDLCPLSLHQCHEPNSKALKSIAMLLVKLYNRVCSGWSFTRDKPSRARESL